MVRGVREWIEIAVFMAMVPFLPVIWLIMYTVMDWLGIGGGH